MAGEEVNGRVDLYCLTGRKTSHVMVMFRTIQYICKEDEK